METTTIIIIVAAGAIIFMIYLRFFKKEKDPTIPKMDPGKDKYYHSPVNDNAFTVDQENGIPDEDVTMIQTEEEIEEANKEFDAPEEEITRIIPDEEIEQCTNEHEKEMLRINNYFIFNNIKNIIDNKFFDIQENIMLDSHSDRADLYSDIHQIFQIAENRHIAITDLPESEIQAEDQKPTKLKGILGIIECRNSIGNAWIEPYNEKREKEKKKAQEEYEEAELVADVFLTETDSKIGQNLLHAGPDIDLTAAESLSSELEKFSGDYFAYLVGRKVYIRINRPARLDDAKTMVEILTNFQK
mgnify:CR=1 FL=1